MKETHTPVGDKEGGGGGGANDSCIRKERLTVECTLVDEIYTSVNIVEEDVASV